MLAPVSMPPGWLDRDVAAVHQAARLLQLPEFAFFRLAYRRWHGRGVRDRELEAVFMSYLLRRRVPPWVRHLAREVQERNRAGVLAPQDYGIEPAAPPPTAVVEERRRRLLVALAWGGFTAIALYAL
jgi:hypothetical protein